MSHYNKQTVTILRQLLKDRGIPSTGLTRKAQIVEKLEEWDSKDGASAQVRDHTTEVRAEAVRGDALEKDAGITIEDGKVNGDEVLEKAEGLPPDPSKIPEVNKEVMQEQPVTTASDTVEEDAKSDTKTEPSSAQPTRPLRSPDATSAERTPSSAPDEKPSIEKAQLLPIPERSPTTTAEPGTRLNTEELDAETRKRKRRSQTPELTSQDVRIKKSRPDNDNTPNIPLQDDENGRHPVMEARVPEADEKQVDQEAIEMATYNDDSQVLEKSGSPHVAAMVLPGPHSSNSPSSAAASAPPQGKEKAPQYRELLSPKEILETPVANASADDRPIAPALHPATPALYIRNLMRPLRPELLRTHLVNLASPPTGPPDPSVIKSLFLDSMKTHAFVQFSTITAASRARASLHGSVWPPEGNRKELWVDFIPDDKVEGWIQKEEHAIASDKAARLSGRPALAQRFEVVYPETEDGVEAVFQVVGSAPSAEGPSPDWNPPTSPRRQRPKSPTPRSHHYTSLPPNSSTASETRHSIAKSFATLDDLFSSTQTSKPKLYYKPVAGSTIDLRLQELDRETSHDWTPEEKRKGRGLKNAGFRRGDEMVRFSFDEDDRVVEVGDDVDASEVENESFGRRGGWGGAGRRGGGGDRYISRPRGGGFWRNAGGWRSGN